MAFFSGRKAGGLSEAIFIVVALFLVAIVWATSVFIMDSTKDDVDESLTSTTAQDMYDDYYTRVPSGLDSAFAIILALFWIGAIILAFFVDTHPVWFAISVIGLILVLTIAGVLSNEYVEYYDSLELTSSMNMTYYIMSHLLEFIIGIVTTLFIALFAKSQLG